MVKQLRSEQVMGPKDIQFAHFGVLDAGAQSKASVFTSMGLNAMLLLLAILIGFATKTTMEKKENVTLVAPIEEVKKIEPKPVVKPPKPLPEPPKVKPPEPKIKMPQVEMIEPPKISTPKIAEVKMPTLAPAPPKAVVAAAAPKITSVNMARSASVVNNDSHPTAVALGHPDSPVAASMHGPSVSPVNMQRGLAGMPGSNTGGGPPASKVSLGSGQPTGSIGGTGVRAVTGLPHGVTGGVPGGTGNGGIRAVEIGRAAPPPMPTQAPPTKAASRSGPEVIYKPKPVYTAEATAMHLEGTVSVRIHVSASGAVQVLAVTSGLGHGLDESARQAILATRFKPARDANGNPIDWEGVVNVRFQLAT
jgi:protein TonB